MMVTHDPILLFWIAISFLLVDPLLLRKFAVDQPDGRQCLISAQTRLPSYDNNAAPPLADIMVASRRSPNDPHDLLRSLAGQVDEECC